MVMRYKIVRKEVIFDEKLGEKFYLMYEHKPWWSKSKRWKNCKEFTYASYDSWTGEPVVRNTLTEAEKYINAQILSKDLKVEDIKIYECRDSKLDKILN
jgi:hypothetical protein